CWLCRSLRCGLQSIRSSGIIFFGIRERQTVAETSFSRTQAARSAIVSGAGQAYRTGLTVLSSVILTRLLTPSDFGLVAMVTTCVSFIALVQELGLNQVTIQRARLSKPQLNALFWLSSASSLIFALVFAISSPLAVWFFRDARLQSLVIAFS